MNDIADKIAARCHQVCSVLGIGISNLPLIRFLTDHGAKVVARDRQPEEKFDVAVIEELNARGVRLILGTEYLKGLNEPVIFRSPGLRPDEPEILEAVRNGSILTSEMEWFLELTPARVIGITGSDGKTTTTTLTYLFLSAERELRPGGKIYVGGNIGEPLLPKVERMTKDDIAVVELSSFQLQTARVSAWRAAITNLSPNHLNWHTGMEEYIAAKTNIYKHPECKWFVANAENEPTKDLADRAKTEVCLFSGFGRPNRLPAVYPENGIIVYEDANGKEPLLDLGLIRLPGQHNIENYCTALALTHGLVGRDAIESVAREFTGVAHRLEPIRTVNGVKYYNSSIDSTPTRTAAALSALAEEHPIVICGGYDKHLQFEPLAEALYAHAKAVVLTGATAEKIAAAIENTANGRVLPVRKVPDFKGAVEVARELAKPGDIVLLSPACASFDAFKNFEERGDTFRRIVESF